MNCQKYTRNQSSNILIHCNRSDPTRTYGNEQIDLNKSHLNYNLAPERDITDFDFMKKRCEELNIFKRKDVNWMVSWLVTVPQDFEGDKKLFFDKSYEYLTNKYGEENVISAYVHNDETTPHLHFCFVPVVYNQRKEEYKVNAKQCITKSELQKIHSDMQNYLEKELETTVNLLNGATREGNKSVKQLKETTAVQKQAIQELVENPTQYIKDKVIETHINNFKKENFEEIQIKELSTEDIDSMNKKEARQELKSKMQELLIIKQQNEKLFQVNNRFSNSLQFANELQEENRSLKNKNKSLLDDNYMLESEIHKIKKKYNKLVNVFEHFLKITRNWFFEIKNIFTAEQKKDNKEITENINYICSNKNENIINDAFDSFDKEKEQKKEKSRDYDMEM